MVAPVSDVRGLRLLRTDQPEGLPDYPDLLVLLLEVDRKPPLVGLLQQEGGKRRSCTGEVLQTLYFLL